MADYMYMDDNGLEVLITTEGNNSNQDSNYGHMKKYEDWIREQKDEKEEQND